MNISGEELIFLVFLALVLIGPERLPQYAEQLARLVKNLRELASGAKVSLREELGDDIDELAKYDPRQYDPRRIVRDALLDDVVPARKPAPSRAVASAGVAAGAAAAGAAAADAQGGETAGTKDPVPFDDEAT